MGGFCRSGGESCAVHPVPLRAMCAGDGRLIGRWKVAIDAECVPFVPVGPGSVLGISEPTVESETERGHAHAESAPAGFSWQTGSRLFTNVGSDKVRHGTPIIIDPQSTNRPYFASNYQ
jgi:hypothetical protein